MTYLLACFQVSAGSSKMADGPKPKEDEKEDTTLFVFAVSSQRFTEL